MAKPQVTQEQSRLQKELYEKAAELYPHYQYNVADANGYMGFIKGVEWLMSKMQ